MNENNVRLSLLEKYHESGPAFILQLEDEIGRLNARIKRPKRVKSKTSGQSLVASLRVSSMENLQV